MTFFGWPTLCLRVADLETSKRFYSHLGMRVIDEVPEKRVVLQYGTFNLALMTFLESNLLNLRGGDVFAAHAHLTSEFPELPGNPERYTPEKYDSPCDGECSETVDPDGNRIFFDTNESEIGDGYTARRSIQVLRGAEQELEALGADPRLLSALNVEVLEKFRDFEE